MATNERLRLGVIGTGHMAAAYARRWVSLPAVAFVAVSDVKAASRRKFIDVCRHAGRPAPREFNDLRLMMAVCREASAAADGEPVAVHPDPMAPRL